MQSVSKCIFPFKRSNSIVCEAPSVCDNQDSGETQRAMDLKNCTQSYIIRMLVGIHGLYRFTGSGIVQMYTSEFWVFGNMQCPNNHKIDIYTYIHIYTYTLLNEFLKFTYVYRKNLPYNISLY